MPELLSLRLVVAERLNHSHFLGYHPALDARFQLVHFNQLLLKVNPLYRSLGVC